MSEFEEPDPLTFNDLPDDAREALSFMRGHLAGLIRFDGEHIPIKVVIGPCGRMVASVMVAMLRSLDCTIFLPDEPTETEDEAIQIQVDLEQFEENGPDGALADRWRIYHGEPPDVNWAILNIDAAKYRDLFLTGEALELPNPLASEEAAICKDINGGHEADLKAAVIGEVELEIDNPRLVGIDPLGFDVRGRFDVVRMSSPRVMMSGEDARSCLEEIFARHR